MDILVKYELLLFIIAVFLILVVVFPFVIKEIKKKKEANKLINRIIPVASLTEEDIAKIQSLHPEGRKVYPAINRSVCVGCGTCVMNCKEKGALYIINGKSTLVNPLACRCRGDCERNCLTGALKLMEYGKRLKVTIPQTDENYESNIKGIYIIGAINGAGLIKEAINQGRAAVNHIMKDVYPPELPKVVVVGAGPAGLSAMLSCRKFGLPVECIEKEITANTIRNFPKKKILMAEPVEMPIFGPLWVGDTTREELLDVWDRILKKTGVQIITNSQLEQVEKAGEQFIITASGKRFMCDKVILALGNRGTPRKLGVPGEEGTHVYYNLLDAEEFEGNAVTIVGAGDSSIEAALSLRQYNCVVTLIVRGDGFPRAKLKNRERIARAVEAKEISVYFNAKVNEIGAGSITFSDTDKTYRIKNDAVFVMVGGELPFQFLEKIGINLIETEV
jgi:thioredoxin reductase (NADPH)